MTRASARRWGPTLAVPVVVGSLLLPAGPAPAGPSADPVRMTARINGRSVTAGNERRPIRIHPARPAVLDLDVTNRTGRRLEVRTVRLSGRALGLTFFAYDTIVGLEVLPGATESRRFTLELVGLEGQGTGLFDSSVSLLDARRRPLASERLVLDVRGRFRSVYGLFGLALAVLMVASFVTVLLALARHRLPPNRWRRGVRFLTPGLALGLFLVFTLSALRVLAPLPGRGLLVVLVGALASFALGYLTPSPDEDGEEADEVVGTLPPEEHEHAGEHLEAAPGAGLPPPR